MSLPRVELDYVAVPRRARAVGITLLAVSLAFAGVLLERYRDVKLEIARLDSARALLPGERRTVLRASANDDIKHAESMVRQLALPWAAMIHAVEIAASPDVALLQMEPDARERRLRLMAEAKNQQAMLEYLRRLSRADAFSEVHLASHQVVIEDARRPIQFSALARLR